MIPWIHVHVVLVNHYMLCWIQAHEGLVNTQYVTLDTSTCCFGKTQYAYSEYKHITVW